MGEYKDSFISRVFNIADRLNLKPSYSVVERIFYKTLNTKVTDKHIAHYLEYLKSRRWKFN